jgi:hypothetical protein
MAVCGESSSNSPDPTKVRNTPVETGSVSCRASDGRRGKPGDNGRRKLLTCSNANASDARTENREQARQDNNNIDMFYKSETQNMSKNGMLSPVDCENRQRNAHRSWSLCGTIYNDPGHCYAIPCRQCSARIDRWQPKTLQACQSILERRLYRARWIPITH